MNDNTDEQKQGTANPLEIDNFVIGILFIVVYSYPDNRNKF